MFVVTYIESLGNLKLITVRLLLYNNKNIIAVASF